MKHLDHTDVADFARGLTRGSDRDRIERHLATGCEPCRRSVALIRQVAVLAGDDARWEPPAEVVQRATEILPARRPRPVEVKRPLLARLVFDSLRQPQMAGVRSRQRLSRQVMYRAGDFYIDLRVDAERGQRQISLIGQIASRGVPAAALDVLLISGPETIARAPVNKFGEFHMKYVPGPRLRLRIPLEGEQREVDVPLARLAGRRDAPARSKPRKSR
jgi:hypothetical protein